MFSPKTSTDLNFLIYISHFHLKISDFVSRFSSNYHHSNSVLEGWYCFYSSQRTWFTVVIHILISNNIALNVPHLDFSDSGNDLVWICSWSLILAETATRGSNKYNLSCYILQWLLVHMEVSGKLLFYFKKDSRYRLDNAFNSCLVLKISYW